MKISIEVYVGKCLLAPLTHVEIERPEAYHKLCVFVFFATETGELI